MYPTKPMIKTGCREVSICGRTSREEFDWRIRSGERSGEIAVLVRQRMVDSGDNIDRFMGLLTADANCLRDLHTHVLAVCQIRALPRKAYLEELLLVRLLAPRHLEAVIVSIGRLDRWGSSGARQEATY